jgi:hypothetical protein
MPQQFENINTQYYLKADSPLGLDFFRLTVVDHQGKFIAPYISIAQSAVFISKLDPEIAKKLGIWNDQRIMLGDIDLKQKAEPLAVITPIIQSEAA